MTARTLPKAPPMQNKNGTCRLCQRASRLCKSHIIPEFCYTRLYDSAHRFIEVHDVKQGRVHRGQKGYAEYLLCAECESHVNGFERHARRLFVDTLDVGSPPKRSIELLNVSYDKLKLFFLSILWRSSVSTLSMFRHVDLGRHESELRKRVLESDPGEPNTYGIIVFPLLFEREHFRDFMVEPTPGRMFGGHRVYRFVFSGFVIVILVSAHLPEPRFVRLFLQDEGAIKLYPRELTDFPFLRDVWNLAGETTKEVKI